MGSTSTPDAPGLALGHQQGVVPGSHSAWIAWGPGTTGPSFPASIRAHQFQLQNLPSCRAQLHDNGHGPSPPGSSLERRDATGRSRGLLSLWNIPLPPHRDASIILLDAEGNVMQTVPVPPDLQVDRLDIDMRFGTQAYNRLTWKVDPVWLRARGGRVQWLSCSAPVPAFALQTVHDVTVGTVSLDDGNGRYPALQCDRWSWSAADLAEPISIVDRAFFLSGEMRSSTFVLLTAKKKDRVVLAIDIVDGSCRHTMTDDSVVRVDEISGFSTLDSWNTVHGFQYTLQPSGQLRLLVVTPDGDLQESLSAMPAPEFDSLTIGPSPGLLLHELCVFPHTALTDRQMLDVYDELRSRWY